MAISDLPQAWQKTPGGRTRARGLGLTFDGHPGPHNGITDVPGLAVGYCTLISGSGPLKVGHGPVRTGVTAILPRGQGDVATPVFAGLCSLNGNGELTGAHWIEEAGQCGGPITITNTHSCGIARDASIKWAAQRISHDLMDNVGLPVAAETFDGFLNDINGFHVTEAEVFQALDAAASGPVEEGSVGGGTGMIAYEFKAGSGTASRVVNHGDAAYRLGAFVQANFGRRENLTIAGVPVGRHLMEGRIKETHGTEPPDGSIIAVIATDAPLMPHQLKRLARRVGLGIGRSGACAYNGSGDIFLAFSTANPEAMRATDARVQNFAFLPDPSLDPFFEAVIQATDEAVINALIANETMTGRDDHQVVALPHDGLMDLMTRFR